MPRWSIDIRSETETIVRKPAHGAGRTTNDGAEEAAKALSSGGGADAIGEKFSGDMSPGPPGSCVSKLEAAGCTRHPGPDNDRRRAS